MNLFVAMSDFGDKAITSASGSAATTTQLIQAPHREKLTRIFKNKSKKKINRLTWGSGEVSLLLCGSGGFGFRVRVRVSILVLVSKGCSGSRREKRKGIT